MRFVAGVLALTLFAPLVRAEDQPSGSSTPVDPAPPSEPVRPEPASRGKVPLRVVRVMPESRQALLYDRARGAYALAEVGGTVGGYVVEDIAEDEVTLRREGQQVVLAAPAGGPRDASFGAHARSSAAWPTDAAGELGPVDPYGTYIPSRSYAAAAASAPVDPYGPGASSEPVDPYGMYGAQGAGAPLDPYGPPIRSVQAPGAPAREPGAAASRAIEPGEGGVRVARAPGGADSAGADGAARPLAPGEGGVRVVEAPDSAARGPIAPPPGPPSAPARTPAAGAPTASGSPLSVVLSRREVDSALANFATLSSAIRGHFLAGSSGGLVIDAVNEGSLLHRAGLRTGDVVTAIDGVRLHTLDDAANLYVRAATAKAISAQVVRAGKPVTLHVVIQ